ASAAAASIARRGLAYDELAATPETFVSDARCRHPRCRVRVRALARRSGTRKWILRRRPARRPSTGVARRCREAATERSLVPYQPTRQPAQERYPPGPAPIPKTSTPECSSDATPARRPIATT